MSSWSTILGVLLARQALSSAQMRWVMGEMMEGRADEAAAAGFLVALRMKGETAGEIAEAARVLRSHMVSWRPSREGVVDTCGTGGDASGTFNISTATAMVVAGAGAPVVKHGNRSVSSQSGSADVLAALGVPVDADPEQADRMLRESGLAFCFAPRYHPALRHVAGVRKKLGVPTLFNCLGPLANPAGARRQLLGVGRAELLDLMAEALRELGVDHALVVHGEGGLDEVSLAGPTHVREVRDGVIRHHVWAAADFGLAAARREEALAASAEESARIVAAVLDGVEGPAQRLVLANAAAALVAAGKAQSLPQGVGLARAAITSGRARNVLAVLRASVSPLAAGE